MHEVGLAFDIVAIASEFAEKNGGSEIFGIELEVGECCGVMCEALEMGFVSARKETVAEHAELRIVRVPGVLQCMQCGRERPAEYLAEPCPECGSASRRIVSGREFRLKSIEMR